MDLGFWDTEEEEGEGRRPSEVFAGTFDPSSSVGKVSGKEQQTAKCCPLRFPNENCNGEKRYKWGVT